MEPSSFSGKDKEWPKWKEEIVDYVEAVYPGLKETLVDTSKSKEKVMEKVLRDEGYVGKSGITEKPSSPY